MTTIEMATLIADYLTPFMVVVIGFWFNRRLKKFEHQNYCRNRVYQEEKEQHQAEIERRHKPHIEFTIDTTFFGPQEGFYIAEFVIFAHNKSLIRHVFKDITLRVRGIRKNEKLILLKDREPRLAFPEKLFETQLKPDNLNFMFVEPDVKQQFTFVTRVEDSFACITAKADFHYNEYTPHSIERVFQVGN